MFNKRIISSVGILFFLVYMCCVSVSYAQQVVIKGNIKHAEGLQIKAIGYADLLTFTEKTLATSTIDSVGFFTLTFNTYSTIPIILRLEFHSAMFYVEPNKNYTIKIKPINFDSIYRIVNTTLLPQSLDFSFAVKDTADINDYMLQFDTLYDNFVVDNYYTHARQTDTKPIEKYIKQSDSLFLNINNEYFQNYISYRIASLKLLSQAYSKCDLISYYILPIRPLYFNTAYMQFFNELFTGYLGTGYSKITKENLKTGINFYVNYLGMLDTLGKDTMLRNEVIRELVFVKTLKDLNAGKEFKKPNIYAHVAEMARLSKFEQHRIIAANVVASFSKMFPGSQAPKFKLKDIKTKKQLNAIDLKGKNICLFFWKSNCVECVNELNMLDSIYVKMKDKVVILPINIDYSIKDYMLFYKKHKFLTPQYYWDKDFSLLDDFNVAEVPITVIIDNDNTLVKALGPLPSNDLEKFLQKMVYAQNNH